MKHNRMPIKYIFFNKVVYQGYKGVFFDCVELQVCFSYNSKLLKPDRYLIIDNLNLLFNKFRKSVIH